MLHPKSKPNEDKVATRSKSPPETASRFLQKMLKTVYRKLHSSVVHWREDDEHVHQLRVSARRALAAIHFFEELIPNSLDDWFRKKLKAVLRATRKARELDVLINERQSGCNQSKRDPLKKWRHERRKSQLEIAALHEVLHRKHKFRKQIRHLVSDLRHNAANKTANLPVSSSEWCLKRFRVIGDHFSEMTWTDVDVETLHRLRIEIKQLRYAAEIIEQVTETSNLAELMAALTAIQEQLGLLQDHVTARKQLRRLVKSSHKRNDKKDLRNLIADEDLAIAECVDLFRNSSEFGAVKRIRHCLENIF